MKTTTSFEHIRSRLFAKGGVAPLLALLTLPMAVQGEEYWLKTAVAAPISSPANWTNSVGVAPSAIHADDILHIVKSEAVTLAGTGAAVTHDGAFHVGADDGSTTPTINLQNNLTLNDLHWHSGTIMGFRGSRIFEVSGNAMLDNPSAEHRASFAASSGWAGLILNANLSCSGAGVEIRVTPAPANPAQSLFVVGGDNAAYVGKIRLETSTVPFELASANALGSPSSARSDALSVESANAVLSVKSGITPNAARGIAINASGFRICATNYDYTVNIATPYEDCSSFELAMPISGDYGFTKDGDGTVTLSGAYTAGDIVVANGTLRIENTATFPAGQKISVASGAALLAVKDPSGFVVDAEPGAVVRFGLDPIEIPYDDTTRTATAVTLDSSYQVPSGTMQEIVLSESVALPLHAAPARQEVLTVAAGADDLSADDFVDATEKTYGLPKTAFTVEKDGAGVQHVYLTIRPVVVSVAAFNNVGINGTAETWSSGSAAQPRFDYLVTNTVNGINNDAFAGDSLVISGNVDVMSRGHSTISSATAWPGVRLIQNSGNGGGRFIVSGSLFLEGDYGDSETVTFQAKYQHDWHRLSANLSGSGSLKLQGGGGTYTGSVADGVAGMPQLYGDNSAFFGKILVTSSPKSGSWQARAEGTGAAFGFNSAAALGGALDTFKYDSLELDSYSMMCPAASMDFSTENRGIYGSGPFGFDITNGVTFRVGVPVRMDDDMFKHGGGDLLLGGAISFGENSSKTCYVREGGIGALNDAAVAGLDVVFSNATKIVVSPDAALADGFTGGLSFEPADAATTVAVTVADGFTPSGDGPVTAVIATVPTSAGDLSSRFVPGKVRGLTGSIETESVTVEGTPCTRYTVKYVRGATTILFR